MINSGPRASRIAAPVPGADRRAASPRTLMGLGAFPADHADWLGMLGMHGTYEANMAMNQCDVMVCIGARFDDRVTGRLDAFSPDSEKIHIDIDRSSINKIVPVDLGIVGDCATRARTDDRRVGQTASAQTWLNGRRGSTAGARSDSLAYPEQHKGRRDHAAARGRAAVRPDPATTTRSSPPRSASTRCGPRSISASTARTSG